MFAKPTLAVCAAAFLCAFALARAQDPAPKPGEIDFVRDVQPIFEANCYECHAGKKRRGGLRLDSKRAALKGGKSGALFVAQAPDRSELVDRVLGKNKKKRMPEGEDPLSAEDVGKLRAWIEQGALWPDSAGGDDGSEDRHWAYVAPLRPQVPEVKHANWCLDPIDAFVARRFEAQGLDPSPDADRATLIRRVSLDLIGLPPAPEEVDAFVYDSRADAYERLVDRLLASPRYGERWALKWLDLARYADTNGYEKDLPRSLWPWRDWVIHALNADMPFDEFTVKQLAGDLLPDATLEDQIATGFQRNTMLNDEGGIDAEEFRVVALVDRVNTAATVWLGSTLACAQCHDHKFDPFTQQDYYAFYAFFDNTEDVGVGFAPTVEVPSDAQRAEQAALRSKIADLDLKLERARDPVSLAALQSEIAGDPPLETTGTLHDWTLGEGDVLADLAGSASTLAHADKAHFVDGPVGRAIELGNECWFDCAQAIDFERDQGFSYGGWVKFSGSGAVLGKIDDAHAYRGFDLFKNGSKLEVHIVHDWPADGIKVQTRGEIADGSWMHLCVTYDGSSKAAGIALYVDGVAQELEAEKDTLGDSIRNTVALKLGARENSGALQGALAEIFLVDRKLEAREASARARAALAAIFAKPVEQRSEDQRALLVDFVTLQDPELSANRSARAALKKQLDGLPIPTSMVMRERKEPRVTHILQRGNFRNVGDTIEAATPGELPPLPVGAARNRLTLARWLVDRENPLCARVLVNRTWEAFFGTGIVATGEDFGAQGDLPSHPELLDWLAVECMERGWSQKTLQRAIVTSHTYRQSSRVSQEGLEKDPLNLWLARAPRPRLEAELVRDNALSIAGLLSPKLGGPSVMPPQPAGIWEGSFATHDTPNEKWADAMGEDRWRRGLYTYWRRSASYPSSLTFDGSRRDVCVVKRSRTDNPLQALTTLNDPVYVEAAIGLAARLLRETSGNPQARIARGLRLCVAREPRAKELADLEALYLNSRRRFEREPEAARQLIHAGQIPIDGLDEIELATLCVIANVLLNLDETITRG